MNEVAPQKLEMMLLTECTKKTLKNMNKSSDPHPMNNSEMIPYDELLPSTKKLDDADLGIIQEALLSHFLFKDLQIEIL